MPATQATHRDVPSTSRVDVLLPIAIGVAVAVHGALLLSGSWAGTYDAHVHLFFADHYARDWFSTWDTRWYTGFTTTSYPPGAHMLVASLGRLVGLPLAFVGVQLTGVLLVVVGTYRASCLWVPRRAAGWAALLVAFSPALAEVVHVFGQLPTTVGLGFTLNALPSAHRWVLGGGTRHLLTALAASAAATAAHHVTTLFGAVFFVAPVVLAAVLEALRDPLPGEAQGRPARIGRADLWPLAARRLRRVLRPLVRATGYGVLLIAVLVVVVLPYWLWSSQDPIVQIPIPHASRSDFLEDVNAGLVFWLVPWGPILLALPFALWRGLRSAAWPLAASVALLTVLGLGGTTPVARFLTRGAFDILTFDRFTIWAAVAVLPLMGRLVDDVWTPGTRQRLREWLGAAAPRLVVLSVAGGVLGAFLFAATLTRFRPFQPDPIDPEPIASFLAKDDHELWRYLALGFGDQMAWLSTHTEATTVDGNYHSARRLPELTTRPVERLEGAKYRGMPGLASLQQFLAIPERWNLKFVFSNDRFYDPLLHFSGWQLVGELENDIEVWERPDIAPLPEVLPVRELPAWQRLAWGLLPPSALLAAAVFLSLQAWRPARPGRPEVGAGLRRVDGWLEGHAATVTGPVTQVTWRPSLPSLAPVLRPLLGSPVTVTRRRLQAAGALGALVVPVLAAGHVVRAPQEPQDVVTAWYLALDERRWDDAHALLAPQSRPDLESWLLGQSIDGGGLVDSYAKLDAVTTTLVPSTGASTVVRATAHYITAMTEHDVVTDHRLVRVGRGWGLLPEERDATVALEALRRRTAVAYREGERRSPTTGRTDFSDVQDRPELQILSARLVEVEGRHVVVGEVANVDVDPAALTLTATLRDADGVALASWNAVTHTSHTLLPGASTPFRIEFEGVAGVAAEQELLAGTYDPDQWTPPVLPEGAVPVTFDLQARALVTPRNLDRPLGTSSIGATVEGDGVRVTGRVDNHGVVEAAIPRLLVAVREADGRVAWVDSILLDDAIRPQQHVDVDVLVEGIEGIRVIDTEGRRYDNGVDREDRRVPVTRAGRVPLAGDPEGRIVSVDVDAFVRTAP